MRLPCCYGATPLASQNLVKNKGAKGGLGLQQGSTHVRSSSTGEEGWETCSLHIPHKPLPSSTLRACDTSNINWEVVLPEGQRQRRRWILCSIHGARNISFASSNSNILEYSFQTPWPARRCLCLPLSQRPKHWDSMDEPVVHLERNLFGHKPQTHLKKRYQCGSVRTSDEDHNCVCSNVCTT